MDCLSDLALWYANIQWLPIQDTFIRRDLGINEQWMVVPFEITTWFVDQIWSSLNLYDAFDDGVMFDAAMQRVANNRSIWQSTLTIPEYIKEYQLFGKYISQSWSVMNNICPSIAVGSDDRTFCYGYPIEQMKYNSNIVPWWQWLTAEDKLIQMKYLSEQLKSNGMWDVLSLPMTYCALSSGAWIQQCSYDDLPGWDLVFKKVWFKTKWERNTIFAWTGKSGRKTYQELYTSWLMFAQERMIPYIDNGNKFEIKVIQIPNQQWTWFETISAYMLEDQEPWKNRIINDGFPQGIGLII